MAGPQNKYKNIALTGFMGTGKSSVARALGRLTGYHVVDTDSVVEREAGMSIPEIFKLKGEQGFRALESAAIESLAKGRSQIISTGGGAVLRPENMEALRAGGCVVVNLRATAETVYERTRHTGHRPLLETEDPLASIRQMMAERAEYYKNADVTIETGNMAVLEVAEEVLAQIGWKT